MKSYYFIKYEWGYLWWNIIIEPIFVSDACCNSFFYGVEMEIWCSDDLINVFFFIICLVGNYVAPMDIMMSTFDAYWNRCKDSNLYIVGNTEQLCQKRSITIWTGLRKYKGGIRIKRIKHYFKFYATFNNFYLNLHM